MLFAHFHDHPLQRHALRLLTALRIVARSIHSNGPARLGRTPKPFLHRTLHCSTPARQAHHFFAFTSFKIVFCTTRSATARFNRAFSSSNARSRRASFTSIPPSFFFHA